MNSRLLINLFSAFVFALYLPFVLGTYVIVWLDRKFKFPHSFPRDVARLAESKEWCLNALRENGVLPKDANVEEYQVIPMKQEMIFRSNAGIINILYRNNGESLNLKCFAKFAPTQGSVWNRTIFNLQLNHIKETLFNRYFVGADDAVAAPNVYYSNVSYITGNLCLITEFMSDCIEYQEGTFESFPDEQLEQALNGMAALHARYWNDHSKRLRKIFPITSSTVNLFELFVRFSWSASARKILVKSWNLMNKPETVLHGDARIGNMMFPSGSGKGRFVLIDWQAVRKGKAVYDLAYFLILSLAPEFRVKKEHYAIERYYELLIAHGVSDYSKVQLEEDYRHACLCLLVLLSLPMLSGEASVDEEGARIFAWGMNIWRERLMIKFSEFDDQWLAKEYGMNEKEGRDAIAEMLGVIERRLNKITGTF